MSDIDVAPPELDPAACAALDFTDAHPLPEALEEALPGLRRLDDVTRRLLGEPPAVARSSTGPIRERRDRCRIACTAGGRRSAGRAGLLFLHGGGWAIARRAAPRRPALSAVSRFRDRPRNPERPRRQPTSRT